jgi:hypothetical protein
MGLKELLVLPPVVAVAALSAFNVPPSSIRPLRPTSDRAPVSRTVFLLVVLPWYACSAVEGGSACEERLSDVIDVVVEERDPR